MITKRFKRADIVKVSLFITVLGYALFFIFANLPISPDLCFILLCSFGILVFGGQGVFYLTMLIMLTNTIEYDEWQSGDRNEAVIFSVRPFMVKLSSAIQTGIVSVSLVICGLYEITEKIGDLEIDKNIGKISQDELFATASGLLSQANDGQLFGLSIAMTLIPILLFVATYFIIKKKYIIDEDFYEKITKEIAERKEK
jgi:melibiose permease/lactose/raffinose/galactose permease